MDRPVRDHIQRIKTFIEELESNRPFQKDEIEALKTETDLRSLNLALMHYELALQIENEVIESRTRRKAK